MSQLGSFLPDVQRAGRMAGPGCTAAELHLPSASCNPGSSLPERQQAVVKHLQSIEISLDDGLASLAYSVTAVCCCAAEGEQQQQCSQPSHDMMPKQTDETNNVIYTVLCDTGWTIHGSCATCGNGSLVWRVQDRAPWESNLCTVHV